MDLGWIYRPIPGALDVVTEGFTDWRTQLGNIYKYTHKYSDIHLHLYLFSIYLYIKTHEFICVLVSLIQYYEVHSVFPLSVFVTHFSNSEKLAFITFNILIYLINTLYVMSVSLQPLWLSMLQLPLPDFSSEGCLHHPARAWYLMLGHPCVDMPFTHPWFFMLCCSLQTPTGLWYSTLEHHDSLMTSPLLLSKALGLKSSERGLGGKRKERKRQKGRSLLSLTSCHFFLTLLSLCSLLAYLLSCILLMWAFLKICFSGKQKWLRLS